MHASTSWSVFVISLVEATARRARVQKDMATSPAPWRFMNAATEAPRGHPVDDKRARRAIGRRLARGELGCFASHVHCWQALLDAPCLEYALILEDDVYLDPSFSVASLPELMRELGLDYLRLYSRWPAPAHIIGAVDHRNLLRFKRPVLGTQAYMISRSGAEAMLRHVSGALERPIDDQMDRFWENRLPIYSLYPYPVLELQSPSSIQAPSARPVEIAGFAYLMWRIRRVRDRLHAAIADVFLIGRDQEIRRRLKARLSS